MGELTPGKVDTSVAGHMGEQTPDKVSVAGHKGEETLGKVDIPGRK
jgi:hypothetical protein